MNITTEKPKIIILLGYPRSGSTVLGELINQVPDFLHVGELERLWYLKKNKPAKIPQVVCSCGEQLWDCEFWERHIKAMSSKLTEVNQRENLKMNNRTLVDIKKNFIEKGKFSGKEIKLYTEIFYSLFTSLQTQNSVIIDTSKELWYAKYMESTGLYDLSYIHLVRDLGGVVLSRQKNMKQNDSNTGKINLNTKYLFYDSFRWNWLNYRISAFLKDKKKVEINYVDFLKYPVKQLQKVGRLLGLDPDTSIINSDKEFVIDENHVIHGNRFRFTRGVVKLQEDERWKYQLKNKDKFLIKLLSRFKFNTEQISQEEPLPVDAEMESKNF